jgi:hypothetical protein
VLIPFSSYAGVNSGNPIAALMSDEFRERADALFDVEPTRRQAFTSPGWCNPTTLESLLAFAHEVAAAYADALD